ncbi:glycosyltransferase [Nesterenkonia flava]|uniref:Glycosyltransferase n=1 Tax=Nesterenkonia flava TaxID=469799 RepID=A0ABU1FQ38_9MICC|nr:glycosyltransferase [Nesterenkonia flava]MDR5710773.1 glycosyltransferase [Nesterenkonia flava]
MTLFLGHTRFSIDAFGSAWFNATRTRPGGLDLFSSRQEYLDWLYDADRLERRTQILLEWSLPQLGYAVERARSRGHTVQHIVSYSPTLPQEYQERLQRAAQRYDFLALHTADDVVDAFLPPHALVQQFLDEQHKDAAAQSELFAAYRLDDDDVLSADYFELLAPYVTESHIGFRVSLGLGISGLWRNGRIYAARETYYPKISMGMASVCARNPGGDLTVPQRFVDASEDNHDFADRGAPVITDARETAYLRILHATQSGVLHRTKALSRHWYSDAMSRIHHARPADMEIVAEKFPVLAQHVSTSHGEPEETRHLLGEPLVLGDQRVPFSVDMRGPFIVEVDFATEQEALSQDVAVKWNVEGLGGFDVHGEECVGHFTASGVRYHKKYGYSTWLPTHRQRGRTRYALVNVHSQTRISSLVVLSRNQQKTSVQQIRLTAIP